MPPVTEFAKVKPANQQDFEVYYAIKGDSRFKGLQRYSEFISQRYFDRKPQYKTIRLVNNVNQVVHEDVKNADDLIKTYVGLLEDQKQVLINESDLPEAPK